MGFIGGSALRKHFGSHLWPALGFSGGLDANKDDNDDICVDLLSNSGAMVSNVVGVSSDSASEFSRDGDGSRDDVGDDVGDAVGDVAGDDSADKLPDGSTDSGEGTDVFGDSRDGIAC